MNFQFVLKEFQVWNGIEMFLKLWNESLIQRPNELIQFEIELFWKAMNESLETSFESYKLNLDLKIWRVNPSEMEIILKSINESLWTG